MSVTFVWPWWGGWIYEIVTGVTSDIGMPWTDLFIKCGMKLRIHLQTSMVQPLEFRNWFRNEFRNEYLHPTEKLNVDFVSLAPGEAICQFKIIIYEYMIMIDDKW